MKSKIVIFLLIFSASVLISSCDTRTYDDVSGGVVLHPSYTQNIKPVMDNYCISCHQAGSQDPDLTTYQLVKDNSAMIYQDIVSGSMPEGGEKLPSTTIQTFQNWMNNGMPEN